MAGEGRAATDVPTAAQAICSSAFIFILFPQMAHFVGLACATLLVYLLYGKIGVE